jgi:hypothetical protein
MAIPCALNASQKPPRILRSECFKNLLEIQLKDYSGGGETP